MRAYKHRVKKLVALAATCCLFASCENDVNEVVELGKKKPSIEEGKNIDAYLSMNGKVSGRLTAPLLIRYQGDTGMDADYIVIEMARHILGETWMESYVRDANAGGIERVLV